MTELEYAEHLKKAEAHQAAMLFEAQRQNDALERIANALKPSAERLGE